MEPFLKVEGLTKRYARNVAVDNISFEVDSATLAAALTAGQRPG